MKLLNVEMEMSCCHHTSKDLNQECCLAVTNHTGAQQYARSVKAKAEAAYKGIFVLAMTQDLCV